MAIQVIFSGSPPGETGHKCAHRGSLPATESTLPIPAKLLLVLLWTFADDSGVVSGISFAKLAGLSSMTHPMLRRHFKILERKLYLAYRISGLTGRCVPGRALGVVILNLSHSDYSDFLPARKETEILVARTGYPKVFFIYQNADEINRSRRREQSNDEETAHSAAKAADMEEMAFNRLNKQDRAKLFDREEPFYLYRAFVAEPQRWLAQCYLNFKIYEYAVWLINHAARRLVKPSVYIVDTLKSRISDELCSSRRLKNILGPDGADALAYWLYVFAWDMAREVLKEVGHKLRLSAAQLAAAVGQDYRNFQLFPGSRLGSAYVTFHEEKPVPDQRALNYNCTSD